ncbi:hypothetical protein ACFWNK_10825 [Streptomyces sp. NPDC058417]|uniref:glycoside hydrolase family 16 protein n=1 Tax=unclassified Streptomyces TaxID=2593676 RepID=UPI003647A5A8
MSVPATVVRRRLLAGAVGAISVGSLLSGAGPAGAAAPAGQEATASASTSASASAESCPPPTSTGATAAPVYPLTCLKPVFEDQFNGTALDTGKWNVRKSGWSNDANVSVSGGKLLIDMKRVSSSDQKDGFRGGGISSKKRFGYGYYELTATIPQLTPGWHPAFWGQIWDGVEAKPVYNRPFTELDIFEVQSIAPECPGSSDPKLDGGIHAWSSDASGADVDDTNFKPRHCWNQNPNGTLFGTEHRFGLHYTPTTLTWVLDGRPVRTQPNPIKEPLPSTATNEPAEYNSPMSIWISSILTTVDYIPDGTPVGHSFGKLAVNRVAYYAPDGKVPAPYDHGPLPDPTTTVTPNFAQDAGDWWKNPGSQWTTVTQNGGSALRSTSASGDGIRLLGKPVTVPPQTNDLGYVPDWTNVSAEATITLDSATGQGAGVLARAADAQNFYYLQLDRAKQQVALVKKAAGASTVLAAAPLTITAGTPYKLRFVVEDNTLTGYVDGVKKVTKNDYVFGTGRVGFKGYQQPFTAGAVKITALG